ncbi:MAG: peptidylprolyl isomerase [Acidobacteriota bacterium]
MEAPDGLTLFYCEKIIPKVVRSDAELREIARGRLTERALRRAWAEKRRQLIESAEIRLDWEALEAARPPAPGAVVVRFLGGALTAGQLASRIKTPLEGLSRERIRDLAESLALLTLLRREAEEGGLLTAEERRSLAWSENAVLEQALTVRRVEERFAPLEEAEIREYFEADRGRFERPRHFELAAILLPAAPPERVREVTASGHRLMRRLAAGDVSFEAAAEEHSRHDSATQGGRLGWFSQRALRGTFGLSTARAVPGTAPGELTGLVQEGERLWIFRVLAVEEPRPQTFEEARDRAENLLGTRRATEIANALRLEWIERLAPSIDREPSTLKKETAARPE